MNLEEFDEVMPHSGGENGGIPAKDIIKNPGYLEEDTTNEGIKSPEKTTEDDDFELVD